MGAETRKIEKYGILKLLPEDRGAQNLIVLCDVIQLPYSEYVNVKSNPAKGHYGFACFMYKEYVRAIIDIQFRKQVLLDHTGYVVQLAHQEYCNSKEIATQVGTVWKPTAVDYPILNFDEIRFKLEDGVVISVLKSSIPMKTCDSQGIIQPDLSPPSSYQPQAPQAPPPKDAPPNELIPLTAPYEGINDDGNTYVRGLNPDGTATDPTAGSTKIYADINAYTNPQVNDETVQYPELIDTVQGYKTNEGYSYQCTRQATTTPAGTFCNRWNVLKNGQILTSIEVSLVSPPTFRAVYTPPV